MLGGGGLNIDALLGQQSQVVKTMTNALLNLTEAQAKFLEALGEKEAPIAKEGCMLAPLKRERQ